MIDLKQYAQMIQTGLNALLDSETLQFVVWTDVGRYKRAGRTRNSVTTYINCLLERRPGEILTSNGGLEIANDSITFRCAVPLATPRQTTETVPPEVQADEYIFVEQIRSVLDTYFSTNTVSSFTEDGVTYEAGMEYSFAATGDANMAPMIGDYIMLDVYITIAVVQSGINSRNISIELDGERVPFTTASPNRAGERASETYSDGGEVENIITTTALSIDVSQPMTTGKVTSQFIDYLLHGKRNVYHFLKLTIGEQSEIYPVTFGDISASVEGSLNAGTVMPFIRVRAISDLLSFPTYFTVARLIVKTFGTVTVSVSGPAIVSYANTIEEFDAASSYSIALNEDDCEWDGENYFLQIRACPLGDEPVRIACSSSLVTVQTDQQGVI